MADGIRKLSRLARHQHEVAEWLVARAEAMALRLLHDGPHHPPLFLVGAPRSGTTLPYLYLIDRFRFGFFPNCAKQAWSYPVTATLCCSRLGKGGFRMQNRYGRVEGEAAPSDGWQIFERWFPRYALEPVRRDALAELRRIVGAHERIFRAPFINKNNHNSVRIADLAAIMPEARFVHVTRVVEDAAVSLAEARQRHGVRLNQWWSCPSPRHMDRAFRSEAEQVVHTIVGIQEHVRASLAELPQGRWFEVAYEDFCRSPDVLAQWVLRQYPAGTLPDHADAVPARFDASTGHPTGMDAMRDEIRAEIARIPLRDAGRMPARPA